MIAQAAACKVRLTTEEQLQNPLIKSFTNLTWKSSDGLRFHFEVPFLKYMHCQWQDPTKYKICTCTTCAKYMQVNNMNRVDQKDQHCPYCCKLQLLQVYLQFLAQGCFFANAE